jgi:hypothetical protein
MSPVEQPKNECPSCGRVWTITRWDDCMVPACGCYGDDPWSGRAPCESCGLSHAWTCPKIGAKSE